MRAQNKCVSFEFEFNLMIDAYIAISVFFSLPFHISPIFKTVTHCLRTCALCTGVYTPGMMTDVVREVKEAARIREEALLSRVRALVEERSWSMSESNLKMLRDLEEMKVSFCTHTHTHMPNSIEIFGHRPFEK